MVAAHIAFVISAATVLGLAVVGLAISTAIISAKQTEVTGQRDQARRAIATCSPTYPDSC